MFRSIYCYNMCTLEVLAPFFLIIFLLSHTCVSKEDDCVSLTTCGYHLPRSPLWPSTPLTYLLIKFPFRLKNLQQKNCSYPGYGLSCTKKNETVLELPFSGKFFVRSINYTEQQMEIYDPDGCLPRRLLDLNLSDTPFKVPFYSKFQEYSNYTLFNCSKDFIDDTSTSSNDETFTTSNHEPFRIIDCLNKPNSTYNIQAIRGDVQLVDLLLLPQGKCNKMRTIKMTRRAQATIDASIIISWDKPARCSKCESHGGQCRFNINNTRLDEIGCFGAHYKGAWKKNTAIGVSILFFGILVATFTIIRTCKQSDEDEKEKQLKIEKFLESYKDLTPKRYSYADIKRITNKFQRPLGEGGYGSVYEGKLTDGIPVAVKILNDSQSSGEDFINEVGTIGRIHHINVVRLLGFCADGFRRALIYEYMPKESLEKFIFSSGKDKIPFFGWEKLQGISIGIARGIEYLHQGCEQRILHFDIKPHNILLDHKFNPKISDFGLAKLCSKGESIVSMTAVRGTMGYIAPEVFSRTFGNVSYKSDVYSFGMLLLEMVGGRKNSELLVDNTNQVYFPEWIYYRLEQGEELGIAVETKEDAKIARKLATAALWCIQWKPLDRPSMKSVIQMLEGNSENLIMPPNPFVSSTSSTTFTTIPGKPQQTELIVIKEELEYRTYQWLDTIQVIEDFNMIGNTACDHGHNNSLVSPSTKYSMCKSSHQSH